MKVRLATLSDTTTLTSQTPEATVVQVRVPTPRVTLNVTSTPLSASVAVVVDQRLHLCTPGRIDVLGLAVQVAHVDRGSPPPPKS